MRRANLRIVPITWHPRYKYSIAGLKVNGERSRPMFETMTAAKDELRNLKIIHESNGQAGLNLTDNLRLAAVECTKLLRPYGKTIYDATKHYLEYLEAGKNKLTTELIKSYLQTRKRAGLSERHRAAVARPPGRILPKRAGDRNEKSSKFA